MCTFLFSTLCQLNNPCWWEGEAHVQLGPNLHIPACSSLHYVFIKVLESTLHRIDMSSRRIC